MHFTPNKFKFMVSKNVCEYEKKNVHNFRKMPVNDTFENMFADRKYLRFTNIFLKS